MFNKAEFKNGITICQQELENKKFFQVTFYKSIKNKTYRNKYNKKVHNKYQKIVFRFIDVIKDYLYISFCFRSFNLMST